MAKNLKLKFKNTQLAKAVNLGGLKDKLAKRTAESSDEDEDTNTAKSKPTKATQEVSKVETGATEAPTQEQAKVKARTKSIFSEGEAPPVETEAPEVEITEAPVEAEPAKTEVRPELVVSPEPIVEASVKPEAPAIVKEEKIVTKAPAPAPKPTPEPVIEAKTPAPAPTPTPAPKAAAAVEKAPVIKSSPEQAEQKAPIEPVAPVIPPKPPKVKLGPTGRHVNDLLPKPRPKPPAPAPKEAVRRPGERPTARPTARPAATNQPATTAGAAAKRPPPGRRKEYKDVKPLAKQAAAGGSSRFDSRDRRGLGANEEGGWRRRRGPKSRKRKDEDLTIRPTSLKVRLPITVKDLAGEMKLKASELIQKLFLQGMAVTINDFLEDETTVQFLGSELGCEIIIDTTEEERIRITDKTIKEEISVVNPDELVQRAPVVAFMGHVDHGKTSLIDKIRSSNRVSEEAGAITQHIGAFRCSTSVGELTVLDTPGHEAFSAMRARGAEVTDIVVLVVAGDEGMRQQTLEAVQHAKAAGVEIVVALNKSDKPGFDPEKIYRQLADNELLPEAWGGSTVCVPCSALTGDGVNELLEMLALQSEVLELQSHPGSRARGTVLESEMHKGLGIIATVLVQNGTLRQGDSVVFDQYWGRVKTMRDENGKDLEEAGPSVPVEITGIAGIPSAGEEFIVVPCEKDARDISEARLEEGKAKALAGRKRNMSVENLLQEASDAQEQKILNIVLRADVQGSMEALKLALSNIESDKARVEIIFSGVGEISESDVQLAAASKAIILGFHTKVESHAESLLREHGVRVHLFEVIYHAVDEVKVLLSGLLDRLAKEEDRGEAEVQAVFKSSQVGKIAGCIIREGTITRNCRVRVVRDGKEVWCGPVDSLKRHKDDVKSVSKGFECGITLGGYNEFQPGDLLKAFEVTYIEQEL